MTTKHEGECGRFQAILEARIAGDLPSGGEDARFLEEHAGRCKECSLLAAALERMAEPPPVGEGESRAIVENVLARRRRRRTMRLVRAASAAALAAAIALVVLWPGAWPERGSGLGIEKGTLCVGAGEERSAGSRIADGDAFRAAEGAVVLGAPGLRVALGDGTSGRLSGTGGGRTAIHVYEGRIACRLDRTGAPDVEVEFPGGRVRAAGTAFSVTVWKRGARIDVLEGRVLVGSLHVSEGRSLRIPQGTWADLTGEDREKIEHLLDGGAPERGAAVTAAAPPAHPAAPQVAPQAGPAEPGPHHPGAAHEVVLPTGPVPSVAELLAEARDCRKAKDWPCAAKAYHTMLEEHPGEPEALVALVPLAEIELEHLGEEEASLGHYELYLEKSPDGPLAEEALYGKTRALGALGRSGEEAKALEKFLHLYPSSVHAPRAAERLESIDGGT